MRTDMTEDEVINIAKAAGELARRIGGAFVLDEEKLERLGLTTEQIDRIFAAIDP
jgi:hypothetical protein